MSLPIDEKLNIEAFSRLFDKKSESYKLFWFKAIFERVCAGQVKMTFNELINSMIASAWYMVTEYHLNLGPSDNLERAVNRLELITSLSHSSKEKEITKEIGNCDDRIFRECKAVLAINVPYRMQAPLLKGFNETIWRHKGNKLAEEINSVENLIYYFVEINGLQSTIRISDDWVEYLNCNRALISAWIDYEMIMYLQRRNPSVPGIANKLYPPITRNLEKVRDYWKTIIAIDPSIREAYHNELLSGERISIDHFVPWSYVAHDELWNLCPTTVSINSSKSNNLPKWDNYFKRFADIQYRAYAITQENSIAKELFNKCAKEHLNDENVVKRLYNTNMQSEEYKNSLEEQLLPVYKSAKACGFAEWTYAV